MSTIQATNLKHNASASNNIVLDNAGNATFAGTAAMASSFLRNRIINGDMRIDQRNAGAAVTINTLAGGYTIDRWFATGKASAGVFTVQRLSTPVPAGFTNCLGCTVTTSATPGTSDAYVVGQFIEGFNTGDLGWGAAGAQTVTLSFRVYSSLTGTFGGSIANNAANRCYPFSFSIGSANTWTTISVTIPGDTTGTWLTDNSAGIKLYFDLGSGSSLRGTANAWGSTFYTGVTGGVNVIATNGATFYVTGVQLEVGTVATPFERRQFGQELALCQRYFQKSYDLNLALGSIEQIGSVQTSSDSTVFYKNFGPIRLMGPMRVRPSVTAYNPVTGSTINPVRNANAGVNIPLVVYDIGQNFFGAFIDNTSVGPGALLQFHYSAFAEL